MRERQRAQPLISVAPAEVLPARVGRRFIRARVKGCVSSDEPRHMPEGLRMRPERRDQEIRIAEPPVIHDILGDDLMLGLLELHHFAEFVRLARFALSDHFGARLEHAE